MSKTSVTLMVISGNKMMTKFMQCADVFEKSKVLGNVRHFTINYKDGEKVNFKRANLVIDATKKALDDEVISFIHVLQITNGNIITKIKEKLFLT